MHSNQSIYQKLELLEAEMSAIQDCCTEMDFKLKKARQETESLMVQTEELKSKGYVLQILSYSVINTIHAYILILAKGR